MSFFEAFHRLTWTTVPSNSKGNYGKGIMAHCLYLTYNVDTSISFVHSKTLAANQSFVPIAMQNAEAKVKARLLHLQCERVWDTNIAVHGHPVLVGQGNLGSFPHPLIVMEEHSHFTWLVPIKHSNKVEYKTCYSIILRLKDHQNFILLRRFATHSNRGQSIRKARMIAEKQYRQMAESNSVYPVIYRCSIPGRKPNLNDNVDFDMVDELGRQVYPPIRTEEEEAMMKAELDDELKQYFA